jgi:hypothetical protein
MQQVLAHLPSSSSTPRREKIPDPPKYDGNREGLRSFLTHLNLKLSGDKDLFPDEQKRLAYAVGRLEGKAFNHMLPFVTNNGVTLENVKALSDHLHAAFGDPDRVGTAERKIDTIRQNNRDFAAYYADFSRVMADLENWSETTILWALKRGLSTELQQELLHYRTATLDLTAFIALCQELDSKLRAFNAAHHSRNNRTQTTTTPRTTAPAAQAPTTTPAPAAPTTTTTTTTANPNYHGPAPMDLSSGRRVLTPAERSRRMSEGLCMYCGGAGHMAFACPNNRRRGMQAAALTPAPYVSPYSYAAYPPPVSYALPAQPATPGFITPVSSSAPSDASVSGKE